MCPVGMVMDFQCLVEDSEGPYEREERQPLQQQLDRSEIPLNLKLSAVDVSQFLGTFSSFGDIFLELLQLHCYHCACVR